VSFSDAADGGSELAVLLGAPIWIRVARIRDVRIARRELYSSSNGDRWSLARDLEADRVFVIHEPNAASGGNTSHIELGSFFNRGGHGPEHQALMRLIGTLVDPGSDVL
jgi:hypothetical protein